MMQRQSIASGRAWRRRAGGWTTGSPLDGELGVLISDYEFLSSKMIIIPNTQEAKDVIKSLGNFIQIISLLQRIYKCRLKLV